MAGIRATGHGKYQLMVHRIAPMLHQKMKYSEQTQQSLSHPFLYTWGTTPGRFSGTMMPLNLTRSNDAQQTFQMPTKDQDFILWRIDMLVRN